MHQYIGIDFGTTNSAIAIADGTAAPRLLPFPDGRGGARETWRTVLFFEESDGPKPDVSAGSLAIQRYVDAGGDGRFIQSMKSHLASKLFSKTSILHRNYGLEDLVAIYLREMRKEAEIDLGNRAVVGRPVRYWGARSAEDDERAIARMRNALAKAGFDEVEFETESNAAAAKYQRHIKGEKCVLIADFGGGTSDFSLFRMQPIEEGESRGEAELLSTSGIGIGGDTFDGSIVDSLVAPLLGKGSYYGDVFGGRTEVPRGLYDKLRRWHHLAFLRSKKTMALLERIEQGADDPEQIQRFIHLVEHDLGLPLHRCIESTKVSLSKASSGQLDFEDAPIHLHSPIERAEFEGWIESSLDRLDGVIDEVLTQAGIGADEVDRVFATGGSSFVPALRKRLDERFPGALRGGDEMTSVALGLAERARQVFG